MSSSSGSTVCSSTNEQAGDALHPYIQAMKRTIKELVWLKVMSTWYKIQNLNITYQNGVAFTRAQRAVSRRYRRTLAVNHVTELATDRVLLHAMLRKEWLQLEKISSEESFINLHNGELTEWITEWKDSVFYMLIDVIVDRFHL